MTKMSAVTIGFLLSVGVYAFFGNYEFIGLLLVGFITGYIAHEGVFGGMWNAAVAGAFGTIVSSILFIIVATVGGAFLGLFGGLVGFTLSGIAGLFAIIGNIIYYMIVMGITGAVGGAISNRR